jgi:hypothetical protein
MPRVLASGPILTWVTQNVFHLGFGYAVLVNVRFASFRIVEIANVHEDCTFLQVS